MNILTNLAPLAVELAPVAVKYISNRPSSPASDLATKATSDNTTAIKSILSKNHSINRTTALVAAANVGNLDALDVLLNYTSTSSHHHHSHHRHRYETE